MNVTFQDRIRLLRDRSFALFLLYGLISVFGGAMCYIVLTWTVLELNGGLSGIILISLAFWLPQIVLAPACGVITDRFPRKQLLILCSVLRIVSFLTVGLLLMYQPSLGLCYLLNFLNGLVFTLLSPTLMAFVRELVNNQDLLVANTTCDMNYEVANVAGMGIAGALVVSLGAPWCLILVAIAMAVGALFLFFIKQKPGQQHHMTEHRGFYQDFIVGLTYLKTRPKLLLLYLLNTLLVIQFMISPVILAPFVKSILHGSSLDFSRIEVALSAAIIVGSLYLPMLSRKLGWYGVIFWGFCLMTIAYLLFSFNRSIPIAIILYAIIGFCLPLWALFISRSQELTPKEMQGRMQATFNTLSSAAILGIYLVLSVMNHQVALPHIYWLCSMIGVVAMGLALVMRRFES